MNALKVVAAYAALAGIALVVLAGVAREFECHWFDLPALAAILIGFVAWVTWTVTDSIKNQTVGIMLLVWCLWIFGPAIVLGLLGLLGPLGRLLYQFFIPPMFRS